MIVTVAHDEAFRLRVAAAVRDTSLDSPVTGVPTVEECGELIATSQLSVVLVGPEVGLAGAVEIARAASRVRTPPPVLLVAPPTTDVLRRAMRAGVRDVLPPDFTSEDLLAALEDAGIRASGPAALPGLTVAVFSAKGGVGTSVVASNLAILLAAQAGVGATLVDLDLASADQAIMHGLSPKWTIQDVADGAVGFDAESIRQVLVKIPGTAAQLFPGPIDPALAEMVTAADVASVIAAVRAESPIAVLDTASSFDDRTLAAIDVADVVVVVASLDVSALRALTISLQTLERLGVDPDDILVAVVRADSKSGLTVTDVERAIGRKVSVGIPSTRAVPRSVNEGTPLAVSSRRSSVVNAINDLAEQVLSTAETGFDATAEDEGESSGLFGGILPWGKSSGTESGSDKEAPASRGDRQPRREEVDAVEDQSESGTPEAPDDSRPEAKVVKIAGRRSALGADDVPEPPEEASQPESGASGARGAPLEGLPPPTVADDDDDADQPRRRRRR